MKSQLATFDPEVLLGIPDNELGPNGIQLKRWYEANPENRRTIPINFLGTDKMKQFAQQGDLVRSYEIVAGPIYDAVTIDIDKLREDAAGEIDPIQKLQSVIDGMVSGEKLVHVHLTFDLSIPASAESIANEVLAMLRAPIIPDPELF